MTRGKQKTFIFLMWTQNQICLPEQYRHRCILNELCRESHHLGVNNELVRKERRDNNYFHPFSYFRLSWFKVWAIYQLFFNNHQWPIFYLYFPTQELFLGVRSWGNHKFKSLPNHGLAWTRMLLWKTKKSFLICFCRFQLEEAYQYKKDKLR